jgi:hypothetical protein
VPRSATEQAYALARRAAAIADTRLRVAYLRHELGEMDPSEVVDLVLVATARAEARDVRFVTLMLTISLALADPSAEPLRRAIVMAAGLKGQHEVARRFDDRSSSGGEEESAHRIPDFGRGRPLTLGERKALARTSRRDLVKRVLRDPHPDVITILLGNPSLTEDDVIELCARRPIAAPVLRQVFRDPRWAVRYRVRRTLVRNPYTPLDVALQLALHLRAEDARAVADSPEVAAPIRKACRRLADGDTLH